MPNCTFSIALFVAENGHDDLWHAEFHDCHSTDFTFHADTHHDHEHGHEHH